VSATAKGSLHNILSFDKENDILQKIAIAHTPKIIQNTVWGVSLNRLDRFEK